MLNGSALTTGNNNIEIGNSGLAAESNTIRIGDPAIHAEIFIAGITAMNPAAPNQAVLVDPATGQLGSADVSSFGVVITDPENTAVGDQALVSNTGGYNTATGFGALSNNTNSDSNTATGAEALLHNGDGTENCAYGTDALASNGFGVSGASYNDGFGAFALFNNTDGFINNAFGNHALFENISGAGNTAVGDLALQNNDSTGAGLGNINTAVGAQALLANTDGDSNNAVGYSALENNIDGAQNNAMGAFALVNSTGNGNVALGDSAGLNVTTANNVICIGWHVTGADVSNTCYVGNIFGQSGGAQAVYVNGAGKLGAQVSSRRFKDEIEPMEKASEVIYGLRPVSFRYRPEIDPTRPVGFGLIAEDVAKVNPALVLPDKEGKPFTVRYDAVNAMLLNEFLKAHRKIEEQEATIAQLKKEMEALVARVKEQDSRIQQVSDQVETSKAAVQFAINNP